MGLTRTKAFRIDWPKATFDVDWNKDLDMYEITGSKSEYVYGRYKSKVEADAYSRSMEGRAEILREEKREGYR